MNDAVGVAIVGHGSSATTLLEAARGIVGGDALADIVAVDAGAGETPSLAPQVCTAIEQLDHGHGVLVLVDLLGASPCQCAQREGVGHDVVVLSGLNLAMLLKLAVLDRKTKTPAELAEACAASGKNAVAVRMVPRPEAQTGSEVAS